MYRFDNWLSTLRPDFWRSLYTHPELLDVFAYINSCLAAVSGYKILSAYDIIGIGDHDPGNTMTWGSLKLGPCTYTASEPYPYIYDIDPKWLFISCLHDKQTDPTITLQNSVDFTIIKSKICFIELPPISTFLISKGLYAGTRLQDDIGAAFGYSRQDSYKYRDNMQTLMSLFYEGPTIPNIEAVANIMVNNPVAKYGNETIISTQLGDVITDKYSYSLGGAPLALSIGDVVVRNQPFANAITLRTNKTDPGWWTDTLPELFQKYKSVGVITAADRDLLMSTFLKSYIADIKINLDKIDYKAFSFDTDIWSLLLEGSPTWTDYIVHTSFATSTIGMPADVVEYPNRVRIMPSSIRSSRPIHGVDTFICVGDDAPCIISSDPGSWTIGSNRYSIPSEVNPNINQFWSSDPYIMPYYEPTYCRVYYSQGISSSIPTGNSYVATYGMPEILSLGAGVRVSKKAEASILSTLEVDATYSTFIVNSVLGDQNLSRSDLQNWEMHGTAHIGITGIVVNIASSGYAISNAINIGYIAKTVQFVFNEVLPANTSISIQYSADNKATWVDMPSNGYIDYAILDIYLKVSLVSSVFAFPVFNGMGITIRT